MKNISRWRFLLTLFSSTLLLLGCDDSSDSLSPTVYQQNYLAISTSIEVESVTGAGGETLNYIDEGDPDGRPVLLVSGTGTSVTAALLTTHLSALRDQLEIRLISVQRNGFGLISYDESWAYQDYVEDVETVLDALGVEDFHIFAISGGGPYTSFIAQAMADRILSVHLAATITGNNFLAGESALAGSLAAICSLAGELTPVEDIQNVLGSFVLTSSEAWWGFDDNNPMLAVQGFEEAAAVDWEYTFFSGDSQLALLAEAAEIWRYCTLAIADLSAVVAPVYIYQGTADSSASMINVDVWLNSLVNASAVKVRLYPDEGHWVQYSHLEQIYVDISQPGNVIICNDSGETGIVRESVGQELVATGQAGSGLCLAPTD